MDSSANNTWDLRWWFQFWGLSVNMHRWWRWSVVSLGHWSGRFERYPAATKHFWTLQTKTRRPVCRTSSTLILAAERKKNNFRLMIRRRAGSSCDVTVLNRWSWARLLHSRTWGGWVLVVVVVGCGSIIYRLSRVQFSSVLHTISATQWPPAKPLPRMVSPPEPAVIWLYMYDIDYTKPVCLFF